MRVKKLLKRVCDYVKTNKYEIYDACWVLGMSAILIALAFFRYFQENNVFVDYLDDKGIQKVEELIGDYSGFYVVASTKNPELAHDIASTELEDGRMVLLLPSDIDTSDLILDFYTMWDAYMTSYRCNFDEQSTYTVKGKDICVIQSDFQFLWIDMDVDDYYRVYNSNKDDTDIVGAALLEEKDGVHKEKAKCKFVSYDLENGMQVMKGSIQPRGSASWHLYKKPPFSIKFDTGLDMFDLGVSRKWNLLANNSDKSLLKDIEMFKFANELELQHTPRLHHIHLFINDDYMGVYSVCTKTKRGQNDVNIDARDYLFNWGPPNWDTKIEYNSKFWPGGEFPYYTNYVDVVWPDKDAIRPQGVTEAKKIIQNFVDEVDKGADADLSKVIDLESFAKYYWLQEIALNGDCWYRSNYMWYNHEDGKLYAGPIWDMEWAFGSKLTMNEHSFDNPQGWMVRTDSYYLYLFQNQEFVDTVNRVYKEYDIEGLMYELYTDYFEQAELIDTEGQLNYDMWLDEVNYYDFEDYRDYNYQTWVECKMNFYKKRIDWIAEEMKKTNGVIIGYN